MLLRVVVALALLPLVAAVFYLGEWYLFGGVALFAVVGAWEFVHMMQAKGHRPLFPLAALVALIPVLAFQFPQLNLTAPALSGLFLLSLVWFLFRPTSDAPVVDWALSFVGSGYIALALAHLLVLRGLPNGIAWVWLPVFSTWGSDTLAYFVGRAIGKHQMAPRISPKKTWEGFAGGVGGGMLGAFLVSLVFSVIPLGHALIVGALVGIVAPLGDLSISMMKRYSGVKDSSHLIPGHGGLLDRTDSILFSTVTVYYYIVWIVLGT